MKYSIRETNGKKTYMVNDVDYNSLDDVPQQSRHLFEDKNNNNIPDGFEMPFDMSSPLAMLKSLMKNNQNRASTLVERAQRRKTRRSNRYDQGQGTSIMPTLLKIFLVSLLAFAIYFVYQIYKS